MIETATYIVTLPTEAVDRARAVLASHSLTSKAGKIGRLPYFDDDESGFLLRLRIDEPRLVFVLSDLETLGARAELRDRERRYKPAELAAARWLHMKTATGGIDGPTRLDSDWDRSGACVGCDAGRVPHPPLPTRASAMGNAQVRPTHWLGLLVTRVGIAMALEREGLTGCRALPVRSQRPTPLDDTLRWLHVEGEWPLLLDPLSGLAEKEPCLTCGASGFARTGVLGSERLVYERPPTGDVPDFCGTRESLQDHGSRLWIVSANAYAVLRDLGVRDLRFEPITFLA